MNDANEKGRNPEGTFEIVFKSGAKVRLEDVSLQWNRKRPAFYNGNTRVSWDGDGTPLNAGTTDAIFLVAPR